MDRAVSASRETGVVRVLFYGHSIHTKRQPNLLYVLLDLVGRVITPRYTRCTLLHGEEIYSITRDGWRRTPARMYAFPPSSVLEAEADVVRLESLGVPEATRLRRLLVRQCVFGFLFPRRCMQCSNAIGPIVGCGPVRTPDGLHRRLLARGARVSSL